MTAPVIFRRSPDGDAGWLVSFFVPSKFATKDEVPLPNNEEMSIMSLDGATYAVRVFDGFATIWYVLSFPPSLPPFLSPSLPLTYMLTSPSKKHNY